MPTVQEGLQARQAEEFGAATPGTRDVRGIGPHKKLDNHPSRFTCATPDPLSDRAGHVFVPLRC